jgi:ferrous iron transport protein A
MHYKPLVMVKPGESAHIAGVEGGRHLRARLAAMGLNPGALVRVVANSLHGPFIVALGDTRLALGRGMAHKILVQ